MMDSLPLKLLVENGANVNIANNENKTPLDEAKEQNIQYAIEFLSKL